MTSAATGATGANAAMAAAMQAIKASGAIVNVTPETFAEILTRSEYPLIIRAEGGVFSTVYKYLTSYGGFVFYTKSKQALDLPGECEIIQAKDVWIPF